MMVQEHRYAKHSVSYLFATGKVCNHLLSECSVAPGLHQQVTFKVTSVHPYSGELVFIAELLSSYLCTVKSTVHQASFFRVPDSESAFSVGRILLMFTC